MACKQIIELSTRIVSIILFFLLLIGYFQGQNENRGVSNTIPIAPYQNFSGSGSVAGAFKKQLLILFNH